MVKHPHQQPRGGVLRLTGTGHVVFALPHFHFPYTTKNKNKMYVYILELITKFITYSRIYQLQVKSHQI